MSYGGTSFVKNPEMSSMTRVLKYGSINVMAMEKAFYGWIRKIPFLFRIVRAVHLFFRKFTKFDEFARDCERHGIGIDLFGLKNEEEMEYYYNRFEKNGLKLGTVCCSSKEGVPVLEL